MQSCDRAHNLPHRFRPVIHHFPNEIFDNLDPTLPDQTAAAENVGEKNNISELRFNWLRN